MVFIGPNWYWKLFNRWKSYWTKQLNWVETKRKGYYTYYSKKYRSIIFVYPSGWKYNSREGLWYYGR